MPIVYSRVWWVKFAVSRLSQAFPQYFGNGVDVCPRAQSLGCGVLSARHFLKYSQTGKRIVERAVFRH